MTNQISDPPNENNAGLDFDYNAWSANTQITLTNIPLRPDYMFTLSPAKAREVNAFIDAQPGNLTYTNSKYAAIDRPIILDKPFNELSRYNYVRVFNPAQPNDLGTDRPNYFYYFIQDVSYIATNTTALQVQLDVWTTYINRVRIGRGFFEQGHLAIANEAQMSNNGRDYLTAPEGLDVGVDHVPAYQGGDFPIMRYGDQAVLVTSTLDLEMSAGSTTKPIINVADSQVSAGLLTGTSQYLFPNITMFIAFVKSKKNQAHLIDGITSVVYIPNPDRYWTRADLGALLAIGAYRMPAALATPRRKVALQDWRKHSTIVNEIDPRYRHLSKMLTYPYTYIYMSNKQGQSVVLRPELIAGNDLVYWEEAAFSEAGQRIQWVIDAYNSKSVSTPNGEIQGLGVDYAVFINNFPQTSVTVDGGMLAIARSSQSIAFASRQADWNQRKGLAANQLGYDQATAGINVSTDLMNSDLASQRRSLGIGQELSTQQALGNVTSSVGMGAGLGMVGGGVGALAGAAAGAGTAAINNMMTLAQQSASRQQYNNSASAARSGNAISGAYGGQMRDTNKAFADMATKGDYEMELAGLKAQTADLMASPPSSVGQAGGEALHFLRWRTGFDLQIRVMDKYHMRLVGEHWLRYGYVTNQYIQVPNELQVMTHFTYWKLRDLTVQGNIPDRFVATLRGIIEKGVTIVNNPFDIGIIDPAINKPLPGYSLGSTAPLPEIPDPEIDPPVTTKRKRKRMIVYSTVSTDPSTPGNTWALAGSSPGTDANFIITQDQVRANAFLDATGQTTPVGLTEAEFLLTRDQYRSAVATLVIPGDPE